MATSSAFFTRPPDIQFYPDITNCTVCNSPLKVYKTRKKSVVTFHVGKFIGNYRQLECPNCQKRYIDKNFASIVPEKCRFGYDILVYVGKALFFEHRSQNQIMNALALKNIPISNSQIEYLGRKFIVYLSLAHQRRASAIKAKMKQEGGFILHLDGTCDGKSPVLMSGLDSISAIVLGNIKLPSEKASEIVPFLEKIRDRFGMPIAIVSDMGRGIMAAVKTVFPNIFHFICHFHFLRDIGKDMLNTDYAVIRNRLMSHGIRSVLNRYARALKLKLTAQAIDDMEVAVYNDSVDLSKFQIW
jgi:hypothetical protein